MHLSSIDSYIAEMTSKRIVQALGDLVWWAQWGSVAKVSLRCIKGQQTARSPAPTQTSNANATRSTKSPRAIVHYYPNPGNAGDALIAQATFQIFKRNKVHYRWIDTNSYYKNQAVYEFSMKSRFPNVRWMGA